MPTKTLAALREIQKVIDCLDAAGIPHAVLPFTSSHGGLQIRVAEGYGERAADALLAAGLAEPDYDVPRS